MSFSLFFWIISKLFVAEKIKICSLKIFILSATIRPLDSAVRGGRPTHPTYVAAFVRLHLKVKLKGSRNRPGVAQRVPGGLDSQISMTFGTWKWWSRQPHAPAAFTPRKCAFLGPKLGRWHWGRNVGWRCLRIGCWGECLGLRGTR
jgi:hypothetical protein